MDIEAIVISGNDVSVTVVEVEEIVLETKSEELEIRELYERALNSLLALKL